MMVMSHAEFAFWAPIVFSMCAGLRIYLTGMGEF